jgi:hypothetical protein
MKFSKEALDAARLYVDSHSEIDIANVIKVLKDNTLGFDVDLVFDEACGRTARNLLAGKKDRVGVRSVFSDGKQGHYVNLELTRDLEKIQAIKERAEKQAAMLGRVAYKAGRRADFVNGQISMAEWLETVNGKEESAEFFKQ